MPRIPLMKYNKLDMKQFLQAGHGLRPALHSAGNIGLDMNTNRFGNHISVPEPESHFRIMRCYFNLINGTDRIVDTDGIEVRDLDQARAQAMKAIQELREEDDAEPGDWLDWTLEATDSSGVVLFSIPLGVVLH